MNAGGGIAPVSFSGRGSLKSTAITSGAKSCSGPIFDFRKRPFSSETGTKCCTGEEALKTTFFSHSIDEMRGSVSPCFAEFFSIDFSNQISAKYRQGQVSA